MCTQTLRDVSELAKFFSRSLHMGHKRVTKRLLEQQSLSNAASVQLEALAALWSKLHTRHLDTVAVRRLRNHPGTCCAWHWHLPSA